VEQRALEALEDVLRLLAGAAASVRLYPATNDIRRHALERFAAAAERVTTSAPLRFIIDPDRIRYGEDDLASGHTQVSALAEALHALQVGQLIIAPGFTVAEIERFLGVLGSDPKDITSRGGVRSALVAAGVGHIAVIEVSLRASTEEGLLGLDLTLAPLDQIADAALAATQTWKVSAVVGNGIDEVSSAIDQLEPATRELAAARVAQALMRLPEAARREVLASALRPDASGSRMEGMLSVVAQMNPAALARLLSLVASDLGLRGLDLARSLELPPEIARELQMLLSPTPQTLELTEMPHDAMVEQTAEEMTDFEEDSEPNIQRMLASATPASAAGKALDTTLAILSTGATQEAIAAVGDALPVALRTGAIAPVAVALSALDVHAGDPGLSESVAAARRTLANRDVVANACRNLPADTQPAALAAVITAAGAPGAEGLLRAYVGAHDGRAVLLQRSAGLACDSIVPAAGRQLRTADTPVASAAVRLLAGVGDKRALPVLAQALDHVDIAVRRAAIAALAELGGAEAAGVLGKALAHWDPETRRFVAREIGRARVTEALPALTRIMDEIYLFDRNQNHDLKKEIIRALESIKTQAAVTTLEKVAARRFPAGRKGRELQFLARSAVQRVRQAG